MTQSFGKSMSTSISNLVQPNGAQSSAPAGPNPLSLGLQELFDSRRLYQNIGLPPMSRLVLPEEDMFAPADHKSISAPSEVNPAEILSASPESPAVKTPTISAPAITPTKKIENKATNYDIAHHQHEKDILKYLSDFTKAPEFKPFQTPRSTRTLSNNEGITVTEELAQDFATRTVTTQKNLIIEQVKDRLGRLIYEKFTEDYKWTARFLYYQDADGKRSPFVMSMRSLSSDGRYRDIKYSKLGKVESEKETLYDLKLALH
ncbi:MAG: hypothetical protein IAF58_05975 [Leptolyngbya sp.]|nr:hypothetical protein [Candidatus Melainabacteria bacterium]